MSRDKIKECIREGRGGGAAGMMGKTEKGKGKRRKSEGKR